MATGQWEMAARRFNFHRILVDGDKGPASDFLVQLDNIFIRSNFSYPDTHTLFNFPGSPLTPSLLLVLRTFSEISFRGVRSLVGDRMARALGDVCAVS